MEQCRQFRYIALELCAATLQEYIEGKYRTDVLDITSVFRLTLALGTVIVIGNYIPLKIKIRGMLNSQWYLLKMDNSAENRKSLLNRNHNSKRFFLTKRKIWISQSFLISQSI